MGGQCCASSSLRSSGDGDVDSDPPFRDTGMQTMACKIIPVDDDEEVIKAAEETARLAAEKAKLEADKVAAEKAEAAEKLALQEEKAAFKAKYLAEVKAAEAKALAAKQLAKKLAADLRGLKPPKIKKAQTKVKDEIDVQKNVWQSMERFKGKEFTVQMVAHHTEISRLLQVCSTSSLDLALAYCQKHKEDIGESLVKKVEDARDSIHANELDALVEQLELISEGKKASKDPDAIKELISKCELTDAMEAVFAKVDKKYSKQEDRLREKAMEDARLEDAIRREKGMKDKPKDNSQSRNPRLERRNSVAGDSTVPKAASKAVAAPSVRAASLPVSGTKGADPAKDAQEARSKLKDEMQTAQNIWASMAAFKDKAYKVNTEELAQKMQTLFAEDVANGVRDTNALEKIKALCTEREEFFNRGMLQLVQKAIDSAQLLQKISIGKPATITLTPAENKSVQAAHAKLKDEIQTAQNIWGSMAAFKDKAYKAKTEALAQQLRSLLAQDESKAAGDTTALGQIRAICAEETELINPRVLEHVSKMIDDANLLKK